MRDPTNGSSNVRMDPSKGIADGSLSGVFAQVYRTPDQQGMVPSVRGLNKMVGQLIWGPVYLSNQFDGTWYIKLLRSQIPISRYLESHGIQGPGIWSLRYLEIVFWDPSNVLVPSYPIALYLLMYKFGDPRISRTRILRALDPGV